MKKKSNKQAWNDEWRLSRDNKTEVGGKEFVSLKCKWWAATNKKDQSLLLGRAYRKMKQFKVVWKLGSMDRQRWIQ